MKNIISASVAIAYLALVLAGCGGGGGGGTAAPSQITISGTVSAPAGIALGRSAGREAAATGLVAKASVSVDVYLIDDTGAKSGSSIATGTTNSSGVFSITLPANVSPASNLVVAAGSGNNLMRAFVTGSSVNINPPTELVVEKVAENTQPLSNFTTTELDSILAQVTADATNVNLSGAATINDAKTTMYTGMLQSNLTGLISMSAGTSSFDGYYSGTSTTTSDTCENPPDLSSETESLMFSIEGTAVKMNFNGTIMEGTYNSSNGAISATGTLNYISTDPRNDQTCTATWTTSITGTVSSSGITGTFQISTPSAATGNGCFTGTPSKSCTQAGTISMTKTAYVSLSPPTLVSPANGATGVAGNSTLTWNAVTGATGYEIHVIPANYGSVSMGFTRKSA